MEEKTNNTPQNNIPQIDNLVHDFNDVKSHIFNPQLLVVFIVAIFLGIGSGYLLYKNESSSETAATPEGGSSSSSISKGSVFGSDDMKTFKDAVQGELAEGGIDGEGQFHLVRPGGDSQNVYMTSSIVDLSKFVGKKIKVWGQTQKAQHAGWLMDVGKVEVL
ncbi:MAG: hypothetical protein HYU48_00035 [Candidatus Levybacteria bacterium]|nr:hypothetical protein [Candidatus Levybacteria bacterium]